MRAHLNLVLIFFLPLGRLPGASADPTRHRAVGVRAAAGDRHRRAVHRVDGARRDHGDVRRDRADRRVRLRRSRPPRPDRAHDVADRAFLRAGRATARADPRLRVPTSAARCLPRPDAELHRRLEHRGPAAHRAVRRGDVLLPVEDVPQPAAGRHRLHRARTAARGRAVRDPAPEGARDLAARGVLRLDHRARAGPDDLRGRRADRDRPAVVDRQASADPARAARAISRLRLAHAGRHRRHVAGGPPTSGTRRAIPRRLHADRPRGATDW